MTPDAREAQLLRDLFAKRALMSQRAFGKMHHIGSGPMVWQYLNGRRPLSLKAGCRFARGLGVDISEFSPRLAGEFREVTEAIAPLGFSEPVRQDYVRIPCVEVILKPGTKGYSTKPLLPVASFIAFRHDWLASRGYVGNNLLAIECGDEGMRPTIAKGDLVVINDADLELADASVYAVNYEGRLQMRRVFRDAGSWWLHCDNPDLQRFPRKQLIKKHCFLIGRVIHRQSESI